MSARSFDIDSSRKQGNVQVTHTGDKVAVKLHNTVVVAYDRTHKRVLLNSGGFRTRTTLVAMNRALSQIQRFEGVKVTQIKGVWYVSLTIGNVIEFRDGMVIQAGLGDLRVIA